MSQDDCSCGEVVVTTDALECVASDEVRKPESGFGWPLLSTKSGSRLRS
jgi:hypothetical protein